MMSNSDARKRAAEKVAEDERADTLAATIAHRLTCSRCRMGWTCGGLGEDDYQAAAGIADLIEEAEIRGYEKGMLDPGSAWMKTKAADIAEAERRGAERALLEAADRMPAFHDRDAPEWAITSACRWLRDRAAQIGEVRP